MRLSAKAEYACLATIALARRGGEGSPVRVREIAEEHAIPERYLIQILLQLKAAGLVRSARGSSGGYQLARPPERISLGEVLTAIDGPIDPPREANGPTAQALATVLENLRANEQAVLEQTSLAQLARPEGPPDWII